LSTPAGTEHGDLCLGLAHGLEQQHGGAAAALAEAGAEIEAFQASVLAAALQHLAGQLHRLVFQVTAADGFEDAFGGDHHLRAGIARRRATFLDDGHQHARLALLLQFGEGADPAHLLSLQVGGSCPGRGRRQLLGEGSSSGTGAGRVGWLLGSVCFVIVLHLLRCSFAPLVDNASRLSTLRTSVGWISRSISTRAVASVTPFQPRPRWRLWPML
jgi:hypothetical protein